MHLDLGNISVHYESLGSGTPVVILPPFSLNLQVMKTCLEPVFEKEPSWHRVYVDPPGMGGTKGKDWINPFWKIIPEPLLPSWIGPVMI